MAHLKALEGDPHRPAGADAGQHRRPLRPGVRTLGSAGVGDRGAARRQRRADVGHPQPRRHPAGRAAAGPRVRGGAVVTADDSTSCAGRTPCSPARRRSPVTRPRSERAADAAPTAVPAAYRDAADDAPRRAGAAPATSTPNWSAILARRPPRPRRRAPPDPAPCWTPPEPIPRHAGQPGRAAGAVAAQGRSAARPTRPRAGRPPAGPTAAALLRALRYRPAPSRPPGAAAELARRDRGARRAVAAGLPLRLGRHRTGPLRLLGAGPVGLRPGRCAPATAPPTTRSTTVYRWPARRSAPVIWSSRTPAMSRWRSATTWSSRRRMPGPTSRSAGWAPTSRSAARC